jgi:hypothetical protein
MGGPIDAGRGKALPGQALLSARRTGRLMSGRERRTRSALAGCSRCSLPSAIGPTTENPSHRAAVFTVDSVVGTYVCVIAGG